MSFFIRTLVTAASLWVAMQLVPGLSLTPHAFTGATQTDYWLTLVIVALALGIINAFVRPVVLVLSLPVTCLTLGLFTLVVNGLMLVLVAWLGLGLRVDNILSAIVGALIVSVVSAVLNHLVHG